MVLPTADREVAIPLIDSVPHLPVIPIHRPPLYCPLAYLRQEHRWIQGVVKSVGYAES